MSENEDFAAMGTSLQENVLILLCFDDEASPVIRASIDSRNFDSIYYRNIAEKAIQFIDQFGEPPKDHLPDLLEDILEGKDSKRADIYGRILQDLHEASVEGVNRGYVLSCLTKFIRQQSLKATVTEAVKHLKNDDLDATEVCLETGLKQKVIGFERGLTLFEGKTTNFLNIVDNLIHTGIPDLDHRQICPAPGELFTLLALAGKGKTWFMLYLAKMALMQRKKVLYVSLEMSEDRIMQRMIQSMFSITKHQAEEIKYAKFDKDEYGQWEGINFAKFKDRPSLKDENIESLIRKKLTKFENRFNLIIKQFPTGALTINMLNAYLEGLERHEKFIPDMIVIDYADLMKLDQNNIRTSTSTIYKELRGVGIERNAAIVTASQANRDGEDCKILNLKNLAEDFSKAAISDNIITYNQTLAENHLGLARLFVAKGRNDQAFQQILLSQAYGMAQFCMDSYLMKNENYWQEVEELTSDIN